MNKVSANDLNDLVIKNNYCSGCGICTVTDNSPFKMQLTDNGNYSPIIVHGDLMEENVVCPFADHNMDEDDISSIRFSDIRGINNSKEVGFYTDIYAGHVKKEKYRINGSSGGGVSWLCDELLKRDIVDYIVHVKESNTDSVFFEYGISSNSEELKKGAKSRYYPVSLDKVMQQIKTQEGRYLIVGVPCFIKSVNLLRMKEEVFNSRIRYTVSLVCGHLKSTHYLESIVSQFGEKITDIFKFDFRHKIEGRAASDYGTEVINKNGDTKVKLNNEIFGTNWGLGLFKLKACDYCDDVIGETSDISFGDAWLPEFVDDYLGTNIVIVRNELINEIIQNSIYNNDVSYENISELQLYNSQAGGYRHRREGLTHRLSILEEKGEWYPKKRFKAERLGSDKRGRVYENRVRLREASFKSKNFLNTSKLQNELRLLLSINKKLTRISLVKRALSRMKRVFR
jgi:coenzyme F420 hydrogenase subunit beta